MDKTKVAIGVVSGIGAVSLLPIMGAIGSVSLLGAVLGGGIGGALGMVLPEDEEKRSEPTRISMADQTEEELAAKEEEPASQPEKEGEYKGGAYDELLAASKALREASYKAWAG